MAKLKVNFTLLLLCVCAVLATFTFGCGNEVEEPTLDFGYEYFPTDSAFWAVYQVDSVIYSSFVSGNVDTISVQLREEYAGTFTDNEGRTARIINRYIRYDNNIPWENINPVVWYMVLDKNKRQAERMEGELRFMKMVFPVTEGKTWLGNSHFYRFIYDGISLPSCGGNEWEHIYQDVGQPYELGSLNFNETATILQEDCDDSINKVYSEEVYAKGVGMVYKEQWVLNTGDSTNPEPWPNRAELGHIAVIKMIDYKQ